MSKAKTLNELQEELNSSLEALSAAEKKAADLQNEKKDCSKALQSANEEISSLKTELGLANEKCSKLESDLSVASSKIDELESEVETVNAVNDELSGKVEELSNTRLMQPVENKKEGAGVTLPESTFTVDGQSYKFISPVFMFKGVRIVATEAINNQEQLNELVAAGVGSIVTA